MVYESFDCFQVGKMRRHGRLYITEENICFYCNIVGFESKWFQPAALTCRQMKDPTQEPEGGAS